MPSKEKPEEAVVEPVAVEPAAEPAIEPPHEEPASPFTTVFKDEFGAISALEVSKGCLVMATRGSSVSLAYVPGATLRDGKLESI